MHNNNKIAGGGALYDRFKPQERLVLLLEALARGDEAESARLRSSCPRKTYVGPDAAFDDRFSLAFDTVAIVCGDLRSLTSQLRMLDWAIENVRCFATLHHINTERAFLEGYRCAQGLPVIAMVETDKDEQVDDRKDDAAGDNDLAVLGDDMVNRLADAGDKAEKSTELILRVLSRAGTDLAVELMNVWEAFGHFCQSRLGLPPNRVLDGCGYPKGVELLEILKQYEHVKADLGDVAQYREALCGVWDRRFGEQ